MSLPQLSARIVAAFSKLMVSAMTGDMADDAATTAARSASEEARTMALSDLMRWPTVKTAIGCKLCLTPASCCPSLRRQTTDVAPPVRGLLDARVWAGDVPLRIDGVG